MLRLAQVHFALPTLCRPTASGKVLPLSPPPHLIDEMLKVRRVRVQSVQVRVQGEVGEGLPGGLVGLHLDRTQTHRRLVADRGRGHHGDAVHGAVAQFAAVL